MVKIEELTIKEAKEKLQEYEKLAEIFGETPIKEYDEPSVWVVGKNYFIRTVTMHLMGKLERVTCKELVLSSASWIADNGRFSNFIKGDYDSNLEVEPFGDVEVIVNRGSLIDAVEWKRDLLTTQK